MKTLSLKRNSKPSKRKTLVQIVDMVSSSQEASLKTMKPKERISYLEKGAAILGLPTNRSDNPKMGGIHKKQS